MAIDWIDDPEKVAAGEWVDVLSRSHRPSPFLSPSFLLPWARAFAPGREKRVARWAPAGRAEGFLFLCRTGGEETAWELLGGEDVADALDAPAVAGREEAFWRDLLPALRAGGVGGTVRLPNLVEGSPSLPLLPRLCPLFGYSFRAEETDRSPRIALPASFDEYVAGLGKKERHELRRKMRRTLEALPGAHLRICGGREDFERDFPSFVRLHRESHPDKGAFMTDAMATFFRETCARFLDEGRLFLAVLGSPAGDVAAGLHFAEGRSLMLYNSGFDPAAREANPGVGLLARCIEEAIRRGFDEYDFLRGTERYKYDLGGLDRIVYRGTISPA